MMVIAQTEPGKRETEFFLPLGNLPVIGTSIERKRNKKSRNQDEKETFTFKQRRFTFINKKPG